MHLIVGGVLVLVLGMAAVAAEAEGQDRQPASLEQRYQVLLKEYNDAFQAYARAYGEAKTPEEQQAVVQSKYPWPDKYASKCLALAEQRPKGPVAEAALVWIMTNDDAKTLKKVMDKERLTFRSFTDKSNGEGLGVIGSAWNLFGTPTVFVLDPKRVIRYRQIGIPDTKAIDEVLNKLIKEAEANDRKEN